MELSIRALHSDLASEQSLPQLIARIHEQRGHFRNVTEASLEEEIRAAEASGQGQVDQPAVQTDQPDVRDDEVRRTHLYEARAEMIKLVSQAQNEALTALDFVSLLISKDAPQQAKLTMSPALSQMGIAGMLAYDKLPASRPSPAEIEHTKSIAVGMTCRSLQTAADALVASANRLEAEMKREARYWEQVLSVSDRGWAVCKLPRDRHTLAVRFGFSEASPAFNARGFAALRPDAAGNIILDQGLSNRPRTLRVRIQDPNGIVQTSRISPVKDPTQLPIEALIRQARDSLFEEELFFELIREARSLLPYNVQIIDDVIHIPINSGSGLSRTTMLDLVDCREGGIQDTPGDNTASSALADSVVLALRLLMSHSHRLKLFRRRQPPAPLSNERRVQPILHIMNPVVTALQHSQTVQSLSARITRLVSALQRAHLQASISTSVGSPDAQQLLHLTAALHSSNDLLTAFVNQLAAPLVTMLTIALPSSSTMTIRTNTALTAPTYGTTFQVLTADDSAEASVPMRTLQFDDMSELERHIERLLARDVTSYVARETKRWTVSPTAPDELRVASATEGKGAGFIKITVRDGQLLLLGRSASEATIIDERWDGGIGEDGLGNNLLGIASTAADEGVAV